jgi:hypothetical protein
MASIALAAQAAAASTAPARTETAFVLPGMRGLIEGIAFRPKTLLGDFVQLADGTIHATDTTSPIIWTLAPGGALVAIFNATPRQRILRLTLNPAATPITGKVDASPRPVPVLKVPWAGTRR